MKIFVYKTTNILNGMIYIGVHKCKHKTCSYLGSGYYLNNAIEKYGKNNFKIEIIEEFSDLDSAFKRESEIVDKIFVNRKDTYNLITGGRTGSYLSHKIYKLIGQKNSLKLKGKKLSEERKKQISNYMMGHILAEETKRKISLVHKGKKLPLSHRINIGKAVSIRMKQEKGQQQIKKMILNNVGSKRSEESRKKMREAWKIRKMKNQGRKWYSNDSS